MEKYLNYGKSKGLLSKRRNLSLKTCYRGVTFVCRGGIIKLIDC